MRTALYSFASILLIGCGSEKGPADQPSAHPAATQLTSSSASTHPLASSSAAPSAPSPYKKSTIALPGGSADGVGMDFLLYDQASAAVWVPAGNTGSVDVIDVASGKLTRIEGFPTKEAERNGKKRTIGPSSVTAGDGVIYIGNRGDSTICMVDPKKLARGTCSAPIDSMPDGISYVAATKELWVTTPKDKSIRILDGKTLKQKEKLTFDGEPEGYAVDATRGRFYTNLEDGDKTLAIDLKTHKTVSTWKPNCGGGGPHGVRLAEADGFLFVACDSKVETVDVGHDGAVLSTIDTGDGVDDIDYVPSTRDIYAGAGKAGQLVIAHVDPKGMLSAVATVPTEQGARNAAVDSTGKVYLSHAKSSELVVVTPPAK